MTNKIFLCTVEKKGTESFLIELIKNRHNIKDRNTIYNFSFKKHFKLKVFFIFFKILFSKTFLDNDLFVRLELYNCQLGRHILAQVFSIFKTNHNKLYFFLYKIIFLIKALVIINFLKENKNKINVMYIDHGVYLNGIFFNFFKNKDVHIYSKNFPRGFFYKHLLKVNNNKFEDYIKIKKDKLNVNFREKNFLKKNFSHLSLEGNQKRLYLPWMINKIYKKLNYKNLNNYDYLIYAHAFTDGQLLYGYDGFVSMFDWLDFTINFLLKNNKKIIVKAHPNFNKYFRHFRSNWEVENFKILEKKFQSSKNVLFISNPIKNYDILSLINNKTILVTHHGTPVIEGSFLNFKFICSDKTYWSKKYEICNYWSNKTEYKKILNKNFKDLKFPNKNHLYELGKKIFLNQYNEFGKNFYLKKFGDFYGMPWIKLMQSGKFLKSFNKNKKKHLILINSLKNSLEIIK